MLRPVLVLFALAALICGAAAASPTVTAAQHSSCPLGKTQANRLTGVTFTARLSPSGLYWCGFADARGETLTLAAFPDGITSPTLPGSLEQMRGQCSACRATLEPGWGPGAFAINTGLPIRLRQDTPILTLTEAYAPHLKVSLLSPGSYQKALPVLDRVVRAVYRARPALAPGR